MLAITARSFYSIYVDASEWKGRELIRLARAICQLSQNGDGWHYSTQLGT